MKFSQSLRLYSVRYHQLLAWVAAVVLLLYCVSGMLHPIMSWTGPRAAQFFPPTTQVESLHLQAVMRILKTHQLSTARVVKVVASADGPVLQVTEDNISPRRYFDLNTYQEKTGYDRQQAIWLAQYYAGGEIQVRDVIYQTEFSKEYPWVNRLLPVYRVELDTPDNRRMYIYTEINALASINNDWKSRLQTAFQWLHTWSFLDDVDNARVILLAVILLALVLFVFSGAVLVFALSRRKIRDAKRRWHRYIAYVVWLPLLALSISGLYHLLQSPYVDNKSGLKLHQEVVLDPHNMSESLGTLDSALLANVNQLSLMLTADKEPMYRVSVPVASKPTQLDKASTTAGEHHHHGPVTRKARYQGVATERKAIYLHAYTGKLADYSDKAHSRFIARDYLGESDDSIVAMSLVTHFSPRYDFRNKRLPVWMVEFENANQDVLFVDPVSGIIVDHTTAVMRYERWSFSLLHKWNFLAPLMGRQNRDIVVVLVLLLSIGLTIVGMLMLLIKKRKAAVEKA